MEPGPVSLDIVGAKLKDRIPPLLLPAMLMPGSPALCPAWAGGAEPGTGFITGNPRSGIAMHAMDRMLTTQEEKEQRGLVIDRQLFMVKFGGKEIELTATEFDLLHVLFEERHRVVPRPELHQRVWSEGSPGPRVVDTYVSRLRAKLKAAGHPGITSVRKRGYRLVESA